MTPSIALPYRAHPTPGLAGQWRDLNPDEWILAERQIVQVDLQTPAVRFGHSVVSPHHTATGEYVTRWRPPAVGEPVRLPAPTWFAVGPTTAA
jgi:hypothetical protein